MLLVVGLVMWYGQRRWSRRGRGRERAGRKDVQAILAKNFAYYQKLSPKQQRTFEQRVARFIRKKQFIGRGIAVNPAMQVLIAAAAVQLTFGLPEIVLQHFKRILIYPDNYYSTITNQYHKGEVNPAAQVIVLSWKSFVEGYAQPSDSLNLGLHEMAHALEIENLIDNDEYDFLPPEVWQQWQQQADTYRARMKPTGDFFRAYAATNQQEFFAIAVENFFERPQDFKAAVPKLYHTLAALLRQDPTQSAHPVGHHKTS